MIRRTLPCVLLPLLALPAAAQDGPAELLGSAPQGYNAALEGERRCGLYFEDRCVGTTSLRVERADEKSGATYRVTMEMRMELGEFRQQGTHVALLDDRFAVVSREQEESGSQENRKRRWSREGGAWVREVTEGGQTTRTTFASDRPDYGEEMLVQLMLEAAGGPRPGTYRLPTVVWPQEEGAPREGHIEVVVEPAGSSEHRGKTVPSFTLRLVEADGEKSVCVVDAKGRLLSMRPDGEGAPPLRMTAGTKEELEADARPPAAPEAGSPVAVVQGFLEVLAKARPPEALDELIDWTAVREELLKRDPSVAAIPVEQVAAIFKQRFSEQDGPSPEQVSLIVGMLKVQVEGDDARITMPGQKDPFVLRRRDGRWWIVHMAGG